MDVFLLHEQGSCCLAGIMDSLILCLLIWTLINSEDLRFFPFCEIYGNLTPSAVPYLQYLNQCKYATICML